MDNKVRKYEEKQNKTPTNKANQTKQGNNKTTITKTTKESEPFVMEVRTM